eukprot:TRINITY_DN28044_c0_g1_i1.p1 TRINITY_DN28044_c0_g1~~TRINITY_DN28044_c0_g1_i1.p1  ORF type:complete len:501 (+),score=123.99 TRINITY_DN28044_c0_g1_i1:35-1537(+)
MLASVLFWAASAIVASVVYVVLVWVKDLILLDKSAPPMPPFVPFLGNLHLIDKNNPLPSIAKLLYQKGDNGIMSFKPGMLRPVVFLYSPEYVALLFDKYPEHLNTRESNTLTMYQFTGGNKDILMSSGDYWRLARKAFVKGVMHSVDRSIPIVKRVVQDCIDKMKTMSQTRDSPILVSAIFRQQTFQVISEMSTGRVQPSPKLMEEFNKLSEELSPFLRARHYRNQIPGYRFLPFEDRCTKAIKKRNQILRYIIDQHKRTLDINNPVDFLDALLVEQATDGELAHVDILHVLLDTYLGGIDTSSSTMELFAGMMANYPEVQKKVHLEIDQAIGSRSPSMEDEEKLPYTNAALKEVMRLYPVAAFARLLPADITLGKYTLRKGTILAFHSYSINRNPKVWDKPDEFIPERFLEGKDSEMYFRGPEIPKNKELLKWNPFGLGKRGCPGFPLAKKEVFLQTVQYMQAFEFIRPTEEKIDLTLIPGLVARPRGPLNLKLRYRLD